MNATRFHNTTPMPGSCFAAAALGRVPLRVLASAT
jgi:hypothetical protein